MAITDENTFPLYFQLIESAGQRTELMIAELQSQAENFNITEYVALNAIIRGVSGNDNNILVYRVETVPTDVGNPQNANVLSFLDYVFKTFKEKYPSYIEPPE